MVRKERICRVGGDINVETREGMEEKEKGKLEKKEKVELKEKEQVEFEETAKEEIDEEWRSWRKKKRWS